MPESSTPDSLPPGELLVLGGDSVSSRPVRELARAVADGLASDSRFAPTAVGPTDPADPLRGRSIREAIDAEVDRVAGRPLRVLLAGAEGHLHGWLDVWPRPWSSPAWRTHTVDIGIDASALHHDDVVAFSWWAIRLFDALEVLHGYVTTAGMQAQRKAWISGATAAGTMAPPRWDDPRYTSLDRVVSDVYWVNYFGPAFVDRWSPSRLAGLGIRRVTGASGAVAIWATDMPPPVEPGLRQLEDYSFKSAFYAALGRRTFTRESLDMPEPGEVVPTLDEHRSRTTAADAGQAGTPGQRS